MKAVILADGEGTRLWALPGKGFQVPPVEWTQDGWSASKRSSTDGRSGRRTGRLGAPFEFFAKVDAIATNSNRGGSWPWSSTRPPFAYQRIAREAVRLHRLGMPATAIARILKVTDKTVAKAIRVRWLE